MFLTKTGYAQPAYDEGPLIPGVDRIARIDAAVSYVFGPAL